MRPQFIAKARVEWIQLTTVPREVYLRHVQGAYQFLNSQPSRKGTRWVMVGTYTNEITLLQFLDDVEVAAHEIARGKAA